MGELFSAYSDMNGNNSACQHEDGEAIYRATGNMSEEQSEAYIII